MVRNEQTTVAFVLSGGGSLGAIQVGMLRALYERDIAPDLIVGTSAGALNGAFVASRSQTCETADELAEIWRGLRRGQAFPLNPLTGLFGFLGSRNHLVPDSGLRRLISDYVEHEALEKMPVPLHVVAVDVVSGEELRLSPALCSMPCWPVRLYPLYSRRSRGGTAYSWTAEWPTTRRSLTPPSGMALHAISLLTHRRLVDDIERHRDDAHLIALPPPCPLDVQPVDFGHAD